MTEYTVVNLVLNSDKELVAICPNCRGHLRVIVPLHTLDIVLGCPVCNCPIVITPTKDGEARVAQWVAFCQNCSYPNRFTEKPDPTSDDGCFSCGLPIHRPVHEIDQDARADAIISTAYECKRCNNVLYYTSPPLGPCPLCGFGTGDDDLKGWTYYRTLSAPHEPTTDSHDWRYSAGRDVRVDSSNPYRACETCGEMWLAGKLVRPGDGRCEQPAPSNPSLVRAETLKRRYEKLHSENLRMSSELARLSGFEEECKLLTRKLKAVEQLAVGDNKPILEELNSDAYQAVRARIDADYPQKPLRERVIWADCTCERCQSLPSEERVKIATPLGEYDPPNTFYRAMLKNIFKRDALR